MSSRPWHIVVALVAILLFGLAQLRTGSDNCVAEARALVMSSEVLKARVGPVRELSVSRSLSVQDAVSVDDRFVPGYRSYVLTLRGDHGNARVEVKTGLKDCSTQIVSVQKD